MTSPDSLTGIGRLIRLVVRRDRLRLPIWILGLSVVVVASAASLSPLYPDQESIEEYTELFGDNPALVAFAGPGYGFDDPNLGVILVNETQLWACVGVALMSIFLVNRHTRAEEDAERSELLRSNVVGRHAPTAAAVTVVAAANVVVSVVCGAAFIALGYAATGSLALAASLLICGLVFTGLAAVAAQLAGGSRSTLGLASAFLGAAFVIRAVGDIAGSPVRYLSPIGLAQGIRAYADERWWVLGVGVVVAVALTVAAFWIATRRDLGSGILPQRPGRRRAPAWLSGPLGLAFRLQRGSIIGWSVGLLLVGTVYGSIGNDVETMIEDNEAFADVLAQAAGSNITDQFLATAIAQLAVLAAGFAISSALRPRSEEASGLAESVLAAPISRAGWVRSHLIVTGVGTVVVLLAGGLGMGASFAVVTGDAGELPRLLGATLVVLPAVLVLAALASALFGASPRFALVAWAGLAVTVLVELFGEVLRLPAWARALSPLHHVPGVPAEDLRLVPLALLVFVAGVLIAAGLRGVGHRDVAAA